MKTKSFQVSSVIEINQVLQQLDFAIFRPTLAIIFASVNCDLANLCTIFNQYNIDLVGCSSSGEIMDMDIMDEKIVCLLLDMNKDSYQIYTKPTPTQVAMPTYQVAYKMGQMAQANFDKPAVIVFSGGLKTDAQQIISGLQAGNPNEMPIYGGLAGDDLRWQDTYVFSNNWLCEDGLVSLVIDRNKVAVEGMAVSGWTSVGLVNTVTKSKGNILYEINGEPALDFFIKYLGFHDKDSDYGMGQVKTLTGQYPLQMMREGGHTVLRSVLMTDELNRSLILAGGIQKGAKFKFSMAPGFEVVEQTVEEFSFLKNDCPNADALLLVSCKGRHAAFGPMVEDEIAGIYDYWERPLIGFFSYGEIGKVKNGDCEFHSVTCTLITLKEI